MSGIMTFEDAMLKAGDILTAQNILPPTAHKRLRASLEVWIDTDGRYEKAVRLSDDDEPYTVSPVTPESLARSGRSARPHGLAEQLQYLSPKIDVFRYRSMMQQLDSWADSIYSHQAVRAVRNYLAKGTILADISVGSDIDPDNDAKSIVRWVVGGKPTWGDDEIVRAWEDYYLNIYMADNPKGLCYLTGEYTTLATSTGKDLIPGHANAKLISSNDRRGFTYRGNLFLNGEDAFQCGAAALEKLENTIRYMSKESPNHITIGTGDDAETIIIFDIDHPADKLPVLDFYERTGPDTQEDAAAAEDAGQEERPEAEDWRGSLKNIIMSDRVINDDEGMIVYALLDAISPGRMAVKDFGAFDHSEYRTNLLKWIDDASWYRGVSTFKAIRTVSVGQLVSYAFGKLTDQGANIHPKVSAPWIRRLIKIKLSGGKLPRDVITGLMSKFRRIHIYGGNTGYTLAWITYAALHKYYKDWFNEDFKMELEQRTTDRSYQYGRLLAVYDKIEKDYLSFLPDEAQKKRPTNAKRYTSTMVDRPLATAAMLQDKCMVWYKKLSRYGRYGSIAFYDALLSDIYTIINTLEAEDPWAKSRRLEDTWIFGYFAQNEALYKKHTTEE